MRRLTALVSLVVLVACTATGPPILPAIALPPADLGQQVSVFQSLKVAPLAESVDATGGAAPLAIEALLETDDRSVRLAAFVLSQRVMTMRWDGKRLEVEQRVNLPPGVAASRILRDLQLAYWPANAVRQALPEGWTLADGAWERELRYGEQIAVKIRYSEETRWLGRIEFSNRAEGYRLTIDSVPAEGGARDG